jgi:hypothetical protein
MEELLKTGRVPIEPVLAALYGRGIGLEDIFGASAPTARRRLENASAVDFDVADRWLAKVHCLDLWHTDLEKIYQGVDLTVNPQSERSRRAAVNGESSDPRQARRRERRRALAAERRKAERQAERERIKAMPQSEKQRRWNERYREKQTHEERLAKQREYNRRWRAKKRAEAA